MPLIGKQIMPRLRRTLKFQMDSGIRHVPVLHLKFGENSGLVAKDSSPFGNNGTIVGPVWTKGFLGPALSFDGLDDYVSFSPPDLSNQSFTILLRVKTSSAAIQLVISNYTDSITVDIYFLANGKLGMLVRDALKNLALKENIADLDDGAWHQVGMIWNVSTKTMTPIVDGALKTGATNIAVGDVWNEAQAFYLGKRTTGTAFPFDGVIDEVYIYNRALTAREILELYYGIE